MNNLLRTAIVTSLVLGLSSCATTQNVNAVNARAQEAVLERTEAARKPVMSNSTFVVNDGFYAASSPIETPRHEVRPRLPDAFARDASLQRYGTTMSDMASHVSRISGYRVLLAPELSEGGMIQEIDYKGNLEGLLDYMAGSLNLAWKWDGSRIEIYRYETKMFSLKALAGNSDMTAKLDTTSTSASASSSGGGSTGGTEGSSGQTTSVQSNFDVWEDVAASLKSVLSTGGSLNIAPSLGVVTVRDTPDVLKQVEGQIREFNRLYSRQVLINVEVYAVERNASESVGFDWTLAWENVSRQIGLDFNSGGSGLGSSASTPSFSGVINNGPFSGSGLMVQALSSIGRTTLLTSGTVSALNGQSTPLNISREQAYLQSYSTSISGGVGNNLGTTTLTPGVVVDGFSMNVTPRLLDDNRVLLRFSVDLSSTDSIDTFETPDGNSAIQLPNRSVRNFLQHVSMKSGQTFVLTGMQQTQATAGQSGPFSPKAWVFGGNKTSGALTRTIVIVATPYVTQ